MSETVLLQGTDALEFERDGFCNICLRPAKDWAEVDRTGAIEVHPDFDREGNLVGFLCPECTRRGL